MPKLVVGVIFGGRSVEHEVSVITALQVIENLDKSKYEVIPIYITKQGRWLTGPALLDIKNFADLGGLERKLEPVFLLPQADEQKLLVFGTLWGILPKIDMKRLDVVFPALHGTFGEDGTVQGLLELADIPYVGAGVLGAALGMDKAATKAMLREAGLPVLPYVWFSRAQWEKNPEKVICDIEAKLPYPVIVKPANLGSSIGITRAKDQQELRFGLNVAANYDRRLLVERALEDYMEINCAGLGAGDEVEVSVCEQPVSGEGLLSYEEKYMRAEGKGMKGMSRLIPAPISQKLSEQLQDFTREAFRALDGRGLARVDFLVDKKDKGAQDGKPYINEINTMPGSIAFYLWTAQGITFPQLIDKLIEIAREAHQEKTHTMYSHDTNLLRLKTSSLKGGRGLKK